MNRHVSDAWVLWGAFVLGATVRGLFLAANLREPLLWFPIVDALEYHRWAVEILRGRGLVQGVPFHGPVYPLFLAALYLLAGPNPWWAYLAQALLGGAVCALCARCALDATESPWGAAAAAAAAAFAWPMVYPTGYLLPYVPEMALVAGALALLGSRMGSSAGRFAAAGALMALACHSRPQLFLSVAVLAAAVLGGLFVFDARNPSPPKGERAGVRGRLAAAFLFPVVLVALAWSGLVRARTGALVLVEGRNHGFSLYYANRPGATGRAVLFPGLEYNRILSEADREGVAGPRGQEAYYYGAVLSWILADPAAFARLCARKLALSISAAEIRTGEAEPWSVPGAAAAEHGPAAAPFGVMPAGAAAAEYGSAAGRFPNWFGFGPLFALGLTGLVAGALRGGRSERLHLAFLASGAAYLGIAGVASRYRAPLLPSLAVGAGCLLPRLQEWHRGRRWGATAAALIGILGLLSFSEWAGGLVFYQPERDLAIARALSALGWGRGLEAAEAGLRRELLQRPEDADTAVYLAKIQARRGEWDAAEQSLETLADRFGAELPRFYSDLAAVRSARGDFRGAREAALRAYALDERSLEDCLSATLFGLLASPHLARSEDAYRCPLEASRHRAAYPPVEALAEALSRRRIAGRDLVRALRPIQAWSLTRLLE